MKSPAVVAFVCNWEGYRGLEMAAQKGLTIPVSVKIVRVSCLSRLPSGLLLKAFEMGAGGIILIGCAELHCHYGTSGNVLDQNIDKVRSIMNLLGLKPEQLEVCRFQQSDGPELVSKLVQFNDRIVSLATNRY